MQTRMDSLMEAAVNIAIGLVISTVANLVLLGLILHFPMSLRDNVLISSVFTVISLIRSYFIRRAFNGRSVWTAIKDKFNVQVPHPESLGLVDLGALSRATACADRYLAANHSAHGSPRNYHLNGLRADAAD